MASLIARFVASGGGAGYAPAAPGTFGSLVGLALGAAALAAGRGWLLAATAAAIAAGFWAVARSGAAARDPGWVVIDEVAGQMLALWALAAPDIAGLAAAFLLFRLFDIAKPGPVGWFDRRHDTLGVMGDDLAAGAMAAAVVGAGVWAWRRYTG